MQGISDDYIISALEKGKKISIQIKNRVIKYLNDGLGTIAMPGVKYGITNEDKNKIISIGISFLSDGLWEWPNYLVHYVDKYDLDLPSDFIQNMVDNEWTPCQDYFGE